MLFVFLFYLLIEGDHLELSRREIAECGVPALAGCRKPRCSRRRRFAAHGGSARSDGGRAPSNADRHVDEHHCHRYLDGEKQSADPLPFDVSDTNDAMAKIIGWFTENWRELTS